MGLLKKAAVGTLVLAAATGLYLMFKKEYNKVKKLNEIRDESLKNLGLEPEELNKKVDLDNEEEDLVKQIYAGIRYSDKWDLDVIDIDKCLDTERLLHLSRTNSGRDLTLMFEIPAPKEGDYISPKIGDYVKTVKNYFIQVNEQTNIPISIYLEGYIVIGYKPKGSKKNFKYTYVKLPEEVYGKYDEDKNKALSEFVFGLLEGNSTYLQDIEYLKENTDDLDIEYKDAQIFMRVNIPIKTKKRVGIDLDNSLQMLKHLIDNFEIFKNCDNRKKSTTYTNIMCHAPKEEEIDGDMMYYYVEKEGKIAIDYFTY